ncbi:MAG TPA: tetratricopeptide repeat protein [Spirochaetota bacterium]|nr:tetratricopeptide repeat protein [Spirochaetota bacterium]HNT12964.1 tetratricopeptide repeat protein [Spirochaetota bacterium]
MKHFITMLSLSLAAMTSIACSNKEINTEKANKAYNLGREYYINKQYDLALKEADVVIKLRPDDTMAYILRGSIYRETAQYTNALNDYSKAIEINNVNAGLAQAYSLRSYIYTDIMKEYDKALEDINKALNILPHEPGFLIGLARIYIELSKYNEAQNTIDKIIKIKPGFKDVYAMQGKLYHRMKKYNDAIIYYSKEINSNDKKNKVNYQNYFNRGEAYFNINRYNKAKTDINICLKMNDKLARAYIIRGSINIADKLYDNAINDFYHALRILNSNDEQLYYNDKSDIKVAYFNMATAYYGKNDYEKTYMNLKSSIDNGFNKFDVINTHFSKIGKEHIGELINLIKNKKI